MLHCAKIAALVLLLDALAGSAQGQATDDVIQYRAAMLELHTSHFLWLEFQDIYRGGQKLDGDYDDIFAPSAVALDHVSSYHSLTTIGRIGVAVGAAVLVTGIVVLRPGDEDGGNKDLGFYLVLGGIGISATGGLLVDLGQSHLLDAVSSYNRDLAAGH